MPAVLVAHFQLASWRGSLRFAKAAPRSVSLEVVYPFCTTDVALQRDSRGAAALKLRFEQYSLSAFGASRRRGRLLCSFVPNIGGVAP